MKTKLLLGLAMLALLGGEQSVFAQNKPGIERMYVLYCGDIGLPDQGRFSPGLTGPGNLSVTCYLIKHSGGWLLYDTGLGDELVALEPGGLKRPASVWHNKKTLASQLAQIGVKPDEIRYLAISHAGGDHIGNVGMFPKATLLVQKAEYERKNEAGTPAFEPEQPVLKAEGDFDVFGDGSVKLIFTPGHTPGHQCLLVKLPKTGAILLSGDVAHTKYDWDNHKTNTDSPMSLAALDRAAQVLKENKAEIWIGHEDGEVAKRKYAPAFYQ